MVPEHLQPYMVNVDVNDKGAVALAVIMWLCDVQKEMNAMLESQAAQIERQRQALFLLTDIVEDHDKLLCPKEVSVGNKWPQDASSQEISIWDDLVYHMLLSPDLVVCESGGTRINYYHGVPVGEMADSVLVARRERFGRLPHPLPDPGPYVPC